MVFHHEEQEPETRRAPAQRRLGSLASEPPRTRTWNLLTESHLAGPRKGCPPC